MSVVDDHEVVHEQRLRMSWEEFERLPDSPRTEWVDGEVIVTPPVSFDHGDAVGGLLVALRSALPRLRVVTEVGLWLPRNRLRGPDLMVVEARPDGKFVTDVPVLVVEVLSPSTRSEDTVRKSGEYAAAGISQFWVVDPEAGVLDVFGNVGGGWDRLLRLDSGTTIGAVDLGEHGTVTLDLADILRDATEPQ